MAKAQKKQKLAIRKDDMVIVLSGEGRSKTPRKVLSVLPYEGKVVVEGVNVIKDSQKPNQQQGGSDQNFVEKPYPIHASKVALVDPKSGNDYMLTVQYPEGFIKSLADLSSVPLRAPRSEEPTRLDTVSKLKRIESPTEVDHYQLRRVIDVYVSPSHEDVGKVLAGMQKIRPNVFTYDTTADLTPYFQQGEAWVGVWTDSETYS